MGKLGKFARLARHWVWIAPILLGFGFIAGGAYMIVEGRNAHDEVRDNIVRENIVVADDAPAFGGQLIDSSGEAEAQSDAILKHTLAGSGGYLYAEQGRFFMPEGNYMLANGTYLTDDGSTTQDLALAATDDNGDPVRITTDESQAAKDASGKPVRAWTNNAELAAKDANGAPVANTLRNTAKDSAFLRTSLGVAVMGFKLSDLVVGLGAFLVFMGLINVFIMSPVTYWAAIIADEHEKSRVKGAAAERVPPSPQTT